MLKHIQIKDFAIIDTVELELGVGMTALTGETGAGKSILVDALLFVTGGRADSTLLRHGTERADVSALFDITTHPVAQHWCAQQDISQEGECLLRRVLNRDGRSRAYINGQTVTLQTLRQLGELLLDVHGQMEFQSLMRRTAQRDILDSYGEHTTLLEQVTNSFQHVKQLRLQRTAVAATTQDRAERLDLLHYQINELQALASTADAIQALYAEQTRLAHSGKLAQGAQEITALLTETEAGAAESLLARALNIARNLSVLDAHLNPSVQLLDEALIATREAATIIARYVDELESDPKRQEWVEQRLAALETAARKYRVDVYELQALLVRLQTELRELDTATSSLEALDAQLHNAENTFAQHCAKLTAARHHTAQQLAPKITALMQTLGMPGGRFDIAIQPLPFTTAGTTGSDEIEFMVSANPGQPLRALAKVASGGELSRISLSIQVAAVTTQPCSCLVFDEVDAGVGGAVAETVGQQLRTLSAHAQVLCVTHLAQVASQAHTQIRVSKHTDGQQTHTRLETLTPQARIEEIARMLGGTQISDAALAHSAEMLATARTRSRSRKKLEPA